MFNHLADDRISMFNHLDDEQSRFVINSHETGGGLQKHPGKIV